MNMDQPASAAPAQAETPAAAQVEHPAAPAEPVQPERTFTQKELDDILEKRLSKERRKREDLRAERDVLRKLALERPEAPRPAQEPQQAAKGEPTREQFGTYEEFIEARAAFRAEQTVDRKLKERETQDRERSAQTEAEREKEAFRKSMKDSAKDIEDFDDVIAGIKGTDPVANVSASAIDAAEAPGKVLYHLATHPDEAERIAGLSPGKQAREIVRLEEKLAKPPVKPSKAPDPIKPVGGKSALGDEMPDASKNPEAWTKWRERQIAERKSKGLRA